MKRLASMLLVTSAAAWAQSSSNLDASIVAAEGHVTVQRDGGPWALSAGETLGTQQLIATGADGFARLQVAGGASFEVYANSRVAFRRNRGNSGDLLDVLAGRARIHMSPTLGELQQRVYCRSAIITAREPSTIAVAVDEDTNVRIDVLEGQISVRHALLPRGEPTIVKAVDAIVVEKDEQISRRVERGTLFRHTIKPLHDLFGAFGHGSPRVQEQPFSDELLDAQAIRGRRNPSSPDSPPLAPAWPAPSPSR